MKFTPLRITLIYLGFSFLWVTTTDWLLEATLEGEELITVIQNLKGYYFASITSIILYWMVKKNEDTLKREQELQNKVLSTIPVMITVYRPDLSKMLVNKEFEKVTGWKNQEIDSIDLMNQIFPDKDYQNKVRKFMDKSNAGWKDFKIKNKSGEKIQTTWTNVKLSDDTQLGIGLDITERKKIEEELKKSQQWLHLTTTNSNVGLWEWHPQTGKTIFNEVWAGLLGYTLDELNPVSIDTWNDLVHPEDLSKTDEEIERHFSGETSIYECEVRMKHKEGHWVWILDRGRAIEWDDEGQPTRLLGTHVDITNQKNIEQRINTERRRFEIASNLTSDVIWEWNKATNETWWSEGVESVLGFSPDDYKGNPNFWENHVAEYDRDRVLNKRNEAATSNVLQWEMEYDFIAADGTIHKVKDTAVIQRNEDGTIHRIIGAMVDRTKEIEYQQALHDQSYRFEMIAKSSNDVLYEWNMKTDYVWWSEGWKSRFNYTEEPVPPTFQWWEERLHPDDKEQILKSLYNRIESKGDYWSGFYRFKNGDGNYSHVTENGYFLKNENGENEYMVGTISDITADVVAKEELRRSEEQYRLLFKQNPIPMFIYDPDTLKFTTVNEAMLKKYGYSKSESNNLAVTDIYPKSEADHIKSVLRKQTDRLQVRFQEAEHITKTGDKLIVEVSTSTIFYKNKRQRLVIINDITEQRTAEMRSISAIIEGEERERERIAKELHDGLGQYLSASNMNLKSVYEDLDDIPESLDSTFERGLNFLNHAISETRNISQNLLPKAIQDYGLELAAESLTNQLRKSNNIPFYFYSNLNDVELSNKLQINLFRILQEALNNAIRHGKPTKIEVQLTYSEGEVLMTIEDNGVGFEVDEAAERGLGIRSIKTRVSAMSANLDIISNKGRGTIVSVVVPVQ